LSNITVQKQGTNKEPLRKARKLPAWKQIVNGL